MIIPTGYGQVNFIYGGNGYLRGAQVAIGFQNVAGDNPADTAAVFIANHTTNITPVQGTAISLLSVKVKLGPNATGPENEVSAGVPGTVASNTIPPQSAVLVNKVTALGGRKGRGRSFWPGATEGQTDGAGLLTTTALGEWNDAMEAFFDSAATDDLPLMLLHSDPGDPPTALIALDVEQLMASQRRRIRRVGGRRTVAP